MLCIRNRLSLYHHKVDSALYYYFYCYVLQSASLKGSCWNKISQPDYRFSKLSIVSFLSCCSILSIINRLFFKAVQAIMDAAEVNRSQVCVMWKIKDCRAPNLILIRTSEENARISNLSEAFWVSPKRIYMETKIAWNALLQITDPSQVFIASHASRTSEI